MLMKTSLGMMKKNMNSNGKEKHSREDEETRESSTLEDPLIESICDLQAAQEALQQEIKKITEIGNEPLSPNDDSTMYSNAAADVNAGFHKQIASSSLELQVSSLTENIIILESKSEELRSMLAKKESRIAELETALSGSKFPREESACTIGLSEEILMEVESELESLFRRKIEAEVAYLAITKMMQNLKDALAFTLLEKQEKSSRNQVQVPNNLGEPDSKDLCKLTFCLSVQLMLLILVFWFSVSQLSPNSGVVVPT